MFKVMIAIFKDWLGFSCQCVIQWELLMVDANIIVKARRRSVSFIYS